MINRWVGFSMIGLGFMFSNVLQCSVALAADPKKGLVLKGNEQAVRSISFAPDGKMIAAGGDDGSVHVWDTATGKELYKLKGHTGIIRSVAFSPDGKLLLSAGQDATDAVKLWNTVTGKLVATFSGGDRWFAVFRPDGKALCVGSAIKDISSQETSTVLDDGPNLCGAFSPDGTLFAGGNSNRLQIWDTSTGKVLKDLAQDGKAFWSVAFSPDGKLLASGGLTSGVKLFDVPNRKALEVASIGGDRSVRSVVFSPDSTLLAAAGERGGVGIWNVASGKIIARVPTAEGQGQAVAFTPDGRVLAAASDKDIIFWELTPSK